MFQPKEKTRLDIEIEQLLLALSDHKPESEEFGVIVERLSKLEKIRNDRNPERVKLDTLVTSATNLIGIWMIIRHEELNNITTKALTFVRLR